MGHTYIRAKSRLLTLEWGDLTLGSTVSFENQSESLARCEHVVVFSKRLGLISLCSSYREIERFVKVEICI